MWGRGLGDPSAGRSYQAPGPRVHWEDVAGAGTVLGSRKRAENGARWTPARTTWKESSARRFVCLKSLYKEDWLRGLSFEVPREFLSF